MAAQSFQHLIHQMAPHQYNNLIHIVCYYKVSISVPRLTYNTTTRQTDNMPGVDIRQPGFGNTTTVEWLDSSQLSPSEYQWHRSVFGCKVGKINIYVYIQAVPTE